MRSTSDIFTWIGFSLNIIVIAAVFIILRESLEMPFSLLLIIPSCLLIAIDIVILAFRSKAIEEQHKVLIGVLTLLFVSVVGGILTFCIKNENKISHAKNEDKNKLSPFDRATEYEKQEKLFRDGKISKEEFDKRIAILNSISR